MTKPESTLPVTIELTKPEQDLCLKYCFERTFKTALELLGKLADTIPESGVDLDKVEVCMEDIEQYLKLERIRSKIVEQIARAGASFVQPIENREWDMLAMADRPHALDVIRECWQTLKQVEKDVDFDTPEHVQYYAYLIHGRQGVAWGRNGPPHQYNTHRGVIADPKTWLESHVKTKGK